MPKSRRWTNRSFSLSVEDDETLYPEIVKIAKRDGVSTSAVIVRALREYWVEHREGNYQHDMLNFVEGGHQSNRQLEQNIVDYFVERNDVITYPQLMNRIKKELDYRGKKLSDAANRLMKQLYEKGFKVWQ